MRQRARGILSIVDIRDLRCTTCFAPLDTDMSSGNVVTCRYCRTPLRVAGLGGLLLELTPARADLAGWNQHLYDPPRWSTGSPIELVARIPGEGHSWDVVRSVATFDDFDVTATIRLWEGNQDTSHGGLKFRRNERGLYQFAVSTNGKLSLYYLPMEGAHIALAAWAAHPAVRSARGEPDTLRVVCAGDRIRAYVNGTSVVSARDTASAFGTIGLFAQSVPPLSIGCTGITVREPDRAGEQAAPAPVDASFDLLLLAPAPSSAKIQSIKVLRDATGLGLKESKDLVERVGALRVGQPRAALEKLHAELKALGCRVELRASGS